jgi:hypothetical protein
MAKDAHGKMLVVMLLMVLYGYYNVLELLGMICPIGTYLPPYQTCHHRRFQQWVRTGVFEKILQALSTDLRKRGGIDLSECYIDGTFIIAKKGERDWKGD